MSEKYSLNPFIKPYLLPEMKINKKVSNIFSFQYDDFKLIDYKFHPHIKAKVSV